jgi:hypothetical protein
MVTATASKEMLEGKPNDVPVKWSTISELCAVGEEYYAALVKLHA